MIWESVFMVDRSRATTEGGEAVCNRNGSSVSWHKPTAGVYLEQLDFRASGIGLWSSPVKVAKVLIYQHM